MGQKKNSLSQIKYTKFGMNLGPNRAVIPTGKFIKAEINQSPVVNYRRADLAPGRLDHSNIGIAVPRVTRIH